MKKDNMLLTFLWVGYAIVAILAIIFGYFNYKDNLTTYNLYIFLTVLVLAILMIIIYVLSVKNSEKKAKVIRNVYVDKTTTINGNNDKVSIIHVDEVDDTNILLVFIKIKKRQQMLLVQSIMIINRFHQ